MGVPHPDPADDPFTRRMLQTVLTVAGVAALAALFWAARRALMLIYISGLLATSLSPLVRRIERSHLTRRRNGVPRWLAILAIYAVFVGGVALVAVAVVPPLVDQATA